MIVYEYNITRDKNEISQLKLKNDLLVEKDCHCYICGNKFDKRGLELEHIIPVMLGGGIINKTNADISCIKCHREKTIIDNRIIRGLKTMKILSGCATMVHSLWNLEKLKQFYEDNFRILREKDISDKEWLQDEIICINNNREKNDKQTC